MTPTIAIADDPADLAEAWLSVEQDGSSFPFQRFHWVSSWCDSFRDRAEPQLVSVSVDGRPVLFLPFCRVVRHRLRWLEFADLGFSDYNAPLIARSCPPGLLQEFAPVFARILERVKPVDIVNLDKMPERVGDLPHPLLGLFRQPSAMSGYIQRLPAQPDGHGKDAGRHMRRKLAALQAQGDTAFGEVATDYETAIGTLFELKRQRFHSEWLDDAKVAAFYARVLASPDLARLFVLTMNGKMIAGRYAIFSHDCAIDIMSAFDTQWGRYSPSVLLSERLAEEMYRLGFSALDLGIGDEAYKLAITSDIRRLHRHLAGRTLAGMAMVAAMRLWWAVGRTVRRWSGRS